MKELIGVWQQIGLYQPETRKFGEFPASTPLASLDTYYAFLPDGSYQVLHIRRSTPVEYDEARHVFEVGGHEAMRLHGTWRVQNNALLLQFTSPQGRPAAMSLGLAAVQGNLLLLLETPPGFAQPVQIGYRRLRSLGSAAAGLRHTSADGLVQVLIPGGGWQIEENCGVSQGVTTTTLVRCKRTLPGEFCFLLAKVYTVPPEMVLPVERLVKDIYAEGYRKAFKDVRYEHIELVVKGNIQWMQAALQFVHERAGQIYKLERVATRERQVYVLSYEGQPGVVQRERSMLNRWLDEVRFRDLT